MEANSANSSVSLTPPRWYCTPPTISVELDPKKPFVKSMRIIALILSVSESPEGNRQLEMISSISPASNYVP
jgi:hypothetical protein